MRASYTLDSSLDSVNKIEQIGEQFAAKAGFERLGLKAALSAQRSNGLFSMVERIRRDALDRHVDRAACFE